MGGAASNGEQRGQRRLGGCLTEEAIRASGGGDGVVSLDKVAERSVKVGERSQGRVSGVDLGGSAARKRRRGERALLMGQTLLKHKAWFRSGPPFPKKN